MPQDTQQPETPAPKPTESPVSPAPQPPAQSASAATKKPFPKWLKIVGVIFAVILGFIVIVGAIAYTTTRAPQKVSDQFVNDLQSGDTSAAYALTSYTFRQATSKTQLDQVIKAVGPALRGDEKVTGRAIEKSTGVPQTAVLVYTVKTSNGTVYIKTELQKDGDSWRVINFRSSKNPLETKVE